MSSFERSGKSRSELAAGDRGLVVGVFEPREAGTAAVLGDDQVAELRELGPNRRHAWSELPLEDDRHQVRVVAQVPQLGLDVAVVHVHRDGPQLVQGHHALDPLGTVVRVDPYVVADAHTGVTQVVSQPVRPFLDLGERAPGVTDHERAAVGMKIDNRLEKVREVVMHGHPPTLEHVLTASPRSPPADHRTTTVRRPAASLPKISAGRPPDHHRQTAGGVIRGRACGWPARGRRRPPRARRRPRPSR